MPPHGYERTRGVKWNKETLSFEMWCPSCSTKRNTSTFWPLTPEFWPVAYGLTVCKACRAEDKRSAEKTRTATKRDEKVAANHAYYQENRELLCWKDNQRKVARRAQSTEKASGL